MITDKKIDTINISFSIPESKKIRSYCFKADITKREFFRRASDHYLKFIKENQ